MTGFSLATTVVHAQVDAIISQKPDAELMSDLDSTLTWAEHNKGDASRVGTIGFCRGGRTVWLYSAHKPKLKAAVAFYGVLTGKTTSIQPQTATDVAGEIKCPLLGLYGSKDAVNPTDAVHEAETKAKAAHKTVDIVIYPDAPHGFHADYRPSYRPADAEDARQRAIARFKRYNIG